MFPYLELLVYADSCLVIGIVVWGLRDISSSDRQNLLCNGVGVYMLTEQDRDHSPSSISLFPQLALLLHCFEANIDLWLYA